MPTIMRIPGAPGEGTAVPADVLSGRTFTNDDDTFMGTMTNNGNVDINVENGDTYTIPWGFHAGSGTVKPVFKAEVLNTQHMPNYYYTASYTTNKVIKCGIVVAGGAYDYSYIGERTAPSFTVTSGTITRIHGSNNRNGTTGTVIGIAKIQNIPAGATITMTTGGGAVYAPFMQVIEI